MLAKNLTFLAQADAAGIVLGARVPIILTSRADSRAHPPGLLRGRRALRQRAPARRPRFRRPDAWTRSSSSTPARRASSSRSSRRRRRGLERRVRGPDRRHRRPAAPARHRRRRRGAGRPELSRRPTSPDLPAAIAETARAGSRASAASSCAPSATASSTAARTTTGRCCIDADVLDRLDRARAAGAAAPAEQPRADPARAGDRPGPAAGRLLRHRLPPRPCRAHRLLRAAARASTTRACAATASTACPTNTSPSGCREVAPEVAGGRVIVAHLGSGASMCALRGGRSVESTMGFTALDGLPMGTRPGQLDPGVVLYLIEQKGMSAAEVDATCSTSESRPEGPLRHLQRHARPAGERRPAARPSRSTISSTAARCMAGQLAAALGGLDAFVFTAGIGENAARDPRPHRRAPALARRRARPGRQRGRRAAASRRRRAASPLLVVPTDEELMIARHTLALVGAGRSLRPETA